MSDPVQAVEARASGKSSWLNFAGPLSPLLKFIMTALALLTLARIGLVVWQWPRVEEVEGLWKVLLFGLRIDIILISYLLLPVVLLMLLLPGRISQGIAWRKICSAWLGFWLVFLVFMETATPPFILQYDLRPNRIFFEYLDHPIEVALTLWGGFKIHLMIALLVSALVIFFARKIFTTTREAGIAWGTKKRLVILPLVLVLLAIGGRSSFDHRPANASTVAFSSDHLVNELSLNSA